MFLASDDVCHSSKSTTDCLGGQLSPTAKGATGAGWARANDRRTHESINGRGSLAIEGAYPFANSNHPGGANFVFCDGSVKFLSETIDGSVYARIITPGGERLPSALKQSPLPEDWMGD
jgi:prepilin-type processing-associated H-X9-DG protein